jgi:hypothetical protein
VIKMLVVPRPVVPRRDAVDTAPPTVLIAGLQVMFATAAGVAPRPAAAPRQWLIALRQRLAQSVEHQPRAQCPPLRPGYFENAAMAREMERL